MADIEEKVGRPLVVAVFKDISQGEFKETLVKLYGPLHVSTEQGHMVHPTGSRRDALSVGTQIGGAEPGPFGCKSGEIECRHTMFLSHALRPENLLYPPVSDCILVG